MNQKKTAEIEGRPSDSNAILNEIVPDWPIGTGKNFNATLPSIPNVNNIDTSSVVFLTLPKILYGIAGIEIKIYFKNLVSCIDKSSLKFSCECPIGSYNDSYWSCTHDKTGIYPIKITVKDANNRIVGVANSQIKIADKNNGNDQNIVTLIVGDSIMGNGKIADFLQENIISNGNNNIRFMGSHSGSGAPLAINKAAVEAYGGWSWDTFMVHWLDGNEYNKKTKFMKMKNGVLTEAVQEYLDKYNNGKAPDIVIFYLGCNDIAFAKMDTLANAIQKSVENRNKLLAMFRKAMPNALFGVVLLGPPNSREKAFELNYKKELPRQQYLYNQLSYVRRTLLDLQASQDISLIPIYVGVDDFEDYPEDNAVHPNETGQRRFAQMLEFWLKNLNYAK